MDLIEAINSRKSIRAFKDEPLSKSTLEQIIKTAIRAPSWSNIQPWDFHIATGDILKQIKKAILKETDNSSQADISPPSFYPEPYDARRRSTVIQFLATKGISKEDKEARRQFMREGLQSFNAPCVIYICTDRSFYHHEDKINPWPLFDCGLVAQNIMLLATSYGLGTIPQAQAVNQPEIIREILGIPERKIIVLALAIGYPVDDDPGNTFVSERAPSDEVSNWFGFD